jgi:osmoprotectant transport system permease protein
VLVEMMQYIIERSQQFTTALAQHLNLTFIALGISVVLGLILGIISTRIAWIKKGTLAIGNLGRTIPSLAILALALPLLGIGTPPTVLALVFIGTLPILVNTIVGIEQVDPNIKESARGMGLNDLQVLLQVEVPIAVVIIMAGIRTSAVLVVASATLAAFIGGGGLGDLILSGHALGRDHVMLAGALPATLLAFYFEETFGRLESWATPKGLKIGEQVRQSGGLLGLLAAAALLPLIFGTLLGWESFFDSDGTPIVLTGLHTEYRNIGLPVLILGLISTIWPRKGAGGQAWPASLMTTLPAVGALAWMTYGFINIYSNLMQGHSLQLGIYLELAAVICITAITIAEMITGLRERYTLDNPAPAEESSIAAVSE